MGASKRRDWLTCRRLLARRCLCPASALRAFARSCQLETDALGHLLPMLDAQLKRFSVFISTVLFAAHSRPDGSVLLCLGGFKKLILSIVALFLDIPLGRYLRATRVARSVVSNLISFDAVEVATKAL